MSDFQAKVILTIGISNCGKSTWAREFIKKNPMYTEINRDDMRIAFFCEGERNKYNTYKFSREKESMITRVAETRAEFATSNGQGIIISDTNLNSKTRSFWKRFAEKKGIPYEEKVFDVPLSTCISRNVKRDITLPKRVLLQQYESYRKFCGMPKYKGTEGKHAAIIVDIGGTVADMTGIRKPYEWSKVSLDKPRENMVGLVRLLACNGYAIVFMSGRDGVATDDTIAWLTKHGLPCNDVFLRKESDNRPDALYKEECFWENVADKYDVKFVLDDRDQMVDQWRSIGLECLQVQPGDF